MNVGLRLILGGVAVFGFLWVAVGAGIITHHNRFRRQALTAQGVITGMRRVSTGSYADGTGGLVSRPTVRFVTADGRDIEAETRRGSNPAPGRVGKQVTVFYDPANPWRFTIDALDRVSGCVASCFIVMGGVLLLIAAVILISVTL